jgi:hypothetical protein
VGLSSGYLMDTGSATVSYNVLVTVNGPQDCAAPGCCWGS